MKFKLEIESDDAAMVDDAEAEVRTLLRKAATEVYDGLTCGSLRDSNGNRVGYWEFKTE